MFIISHSILFIQNSSKAQRVCRFIVSSVQFMLRQSEIYSKFFLEDKWSREKISDEKCSKHSP
jgi:hypothetical protein